MCKRHDDKVGTTSAGHLCTTILLKLEGAPSLTGINCNVCNKSGGGTAWPQWSTRSDSGSFARHFDFSHRPFHLFRGRRPVKILERLSFGSVSDCFVGCYSCHFWLKLTKESTKHRPKVEPLKGLLSGCCLRGATVCGWNTSVDHMPPYPSPITHRECFKQVFSTLRCGELQHMRNYKSRDFELNTCLKVLHHARLADTLVPTIVQNRVDGNRALNPAPKDKTLQTQDP